MKQAGLRDYYTKSQLAEGEVPDTALGSKISEQLFAGRKLVCHGRPDIYTVGSAKGTDHASPYNYDTHVHWLSTGCRFSPEPIARASNP